MVVLKICQPPVGVWLRVAEFWERSVFNPPISTSFLRSRCCIAGVSLNLDKMFCSSIRTISPTGSSRIMLLVTSSRHVNMSLRSFDVYDGSRKRNYSIISEGGGGLHLDNRRNTSGGQMTLPSVSLSALYCACLSR